MKMADRTRIKVAVLEGDYADLCGLGLPISLSLQLQLQGLKLSGALWSAKASASGFSVSLYWPTITTPAKAKVKKARRKRKRGRANKQAIPSVSNSISNVTTVSSAPVLASPVSKQSPLNAHHSPESVVSPQAKSEMSVTNDASSNESVSSQPKSQMSVTYDSARSIDLAACSEVQYEVQDGVHGVSYRCSKDDEQSSWTPVVGRRKKRGHVSDYLRCRFPPDHAVHHSNSSESDSDSVSNDLDLGDMIPAGANVDVHFKLIDGTPGLAVRTRNTRSWTPIAARTRARLQNK